MLCFSAANETVCCPISLTALAVFISVSLAAPTDNSGAPKLSSPNDHIYKNLAADGKLEWKEVDGGKVVSIWREDWDAADAKGKASKRSGTSLERGLERRMHGADIQGLAADLSCYGRGAVAQDAEIEAFAIQACDALVGASVPKPAVKALQVWQSADFADVNGNAGYLRFSFELLNAIQAMPTTTVCQAAMNEFTSFCQHGMYLMHCPRFT